MPEPFPFKAVIFDLDNTLYNLNTARVAAIEALAAVTNDTEGDLWTRFFKDRNPMNIRKNIGEHLLHQNIYSEELHNFCTELYEAVELACLYPCPGMKNVLCELSAKGVKLVILTNAWEKLAHERLCRIGFEKYFVEVVTRERFGYKKPEPEVFLKTLELLEVDPNEAAMIGDKYIHDILPAEELGIFAVHAVYNSREEPNGVFVEKPEEILAVLQNRR